MWQLGLAAAGALLGARQAERKAENQKRYNMGQAEVTRYSPWTGVTGQLDHNYTPGVLEGGLGGGLQGLSAAQGLGGMFDGSKAAAAPAPMAGGPDAQQQQGASAWDSIYSPQQNKNPFMTA